MCVAHVTPGMCIFGAGSAWRLDIIRIRVRSVARVEVICLGGQFMEELRGGSVRPDDGPDGDPAPFFEPEFVSGSVPPPPEPYRPMARGKLDAILASDPFCVKHLAKYEVIEFSPTKTAPELRLLNEAVPH